MLYLCLSLSLWPLTSFWFDTFPIPTTMVHHEGDSWVTLSLSLIFFHYQLFSNPDFEIPVFNFLCLVVVVILQEIEEEGLLDGDSGEEKVAESACRWRGGLRRQLLRRFAPWYHTEAPAFPWRNDSHQGIWFKGFFFFFFFWIWFLKSCFAFYIVKPFIVWVLKPLDIVFLFQWVFEGDLGVNLCFEELTCWLC